MGTLHNKSIRTDRQLALSAPTHISKQMQMELFASRSLHSSASCSSHVCFQKEATESRLSTMSLESELFPHPSPNKSRLGIFFWPASIARFLNQGSVRVGGLFVTIWGTAIVQPSHEGLRITFSLMYDFIAEDNKSQNWES